MPSLAAACVLTITPRWPATLSATSFMSCMPMLAPHAYCMLRAVSSQNGNASGAPPAFASDATHGRLKSLHFGRP